MRKLELIIETPKNDKDLNYLLSIAKIKYNLPIIDSIVIEIDEDKLESLNKIDISKSYYENATITTQMNSARKSVNADLVTNIGYTGKKVGIAVVDTGVSMCEDFIKPKSRLIAFKDFINNQTLPYDDNGHGTHVAGITGGSGFSSDGKYKGVAPDCNIIGVKVLNYEGKGNASDVLAGIQWIIDNREKYNIRIMNLSIGTNNTSSNDPLVKAVEKAWDLGIIVTIAAGNNGPAKYTISSPAISKKVITVGSSDDNKSATVWGNRLVNFSGRGPTMDCIIKPDLVSPGVDIVSCLSKNAEDIDTNIIDENYVSLSGTSMSTPIVSGAIALLLEKQPELKPDDVKLMLKKCCKNLYLPKNRQGWGLLDVYKLLSQEVYYARK